MTDEELKDLVASLAVGQQALQARLEEVAHDLRETAKIAREQGKQLGETEKIIREQGKQLGGLGEKFGSFTEGMAFPSMQKVLREQFGMESIATRYKVKRNGKTLELDVLGHVNGPIQQAVIVEVKSHLREEHISQILRQLHEVKEFLPEHADKTFFGILAVVDSPEPLRAQVWREGLYYAEIHDDLFQLQVPEHFRARTF